MLCSAIGRDGRLVFHCDGYAMLGFRVGKMHIVLELTEDGDYLEVEQKVRRLLRNSALS